MLDKPAKRNYWGDVTSAMIFFGGDNVKSEKEIPIRNVEIPFEIQGKVK